jgi:hypothetical protein
MVQVMLTGRKLYKDDSWNTLCLPFDVVLEGSALDGATLKELDVDGKVSLYIYNGKKQLIK